MATVGSFGIDLGLNTARFEAGLKQAGSSTERFQRGFKSAMTGLAAAGVIAAGGVAAVFAATKNAIDNASAINDASKAAGLAAETYQAWGYSAQLAGVEADAFSGAMVRANKAVGDAANGTGAAAKTFERLGISVRDASGNVLSTERVVAQLADAIKGMQSPAEKAAAAASVFGREAGPKLVAMLEQGSAGMAAAAEEARRLGAVIDGDLIAQADEAGDRLDAMSKIVSVQLTSALVSLTPVITGVAQAFADAAPHVARFFNILRGGNLDAVAGEMGTLEVQIARTRKSMTDASAKVERDMHARLLAEQEARLTRLQDAYGKLMRSNAAATVASPVVELGAAVDTSHPKTPKEKTTPYTETALDRSKQRWGAFLDSAAADHASLLDEFAQQSEQRASELDRGLQSNTQVMLDWYAKWDEQSAQAADSIADNFERVVFAGFRDGTKGMLDAFKSMLVELGAEIIKSKLRETLTSVFSDSANKGGSGWGGVIQGIVGLFGGSSGLSKSRASGGLKQFATGGSFTVPGPASGDKVIPLFRANGGETVTVTPKGKGGSGVVINQTINAPGANQETVAMIRRESAMAARAAVAEVINMRSRGRL